MKWLFLVHQVQTRNSRERVKVWRLTKQVGALLYRNSVYVLPYTKERLEDFQWLCQQIRDSKGEASVFVSESSVAGEDRALRSLFLRANEEQYSSIMAKVDSLAERLRRAKGEQRLSQQVARTLAKELKQVGDAFKECHRTDFFNVPSGARVKAAMEGVAKSIALLETHSQVAAPARRHQRKEFQGKTWATREHIHIDRLCSAWLIQRFVDPKACFVFAPESRLPKEAILFDVFGAEFSHHGEDCTFETLMKSFGLKDPALETISEIVHDIDMKDQKFGRPEAAGLDVTVRALSSSLKDDHKVLEAGSVTLDALYKHFSTTS